MNQRKYGLPQMPGANRLNGQQACAPQPHKPCVTQPKMAPAGQVRNQHAAPSVYRPQTKPQIVQQKAAGSAQMRTPPVAPPAYRPQPTPKVLQTKMPVSPQPFNQAGRASNVPVAPPAYRPQPVPKVLQTKSSSGQNPSAGQAPRQPVAPPVYRPQGKPVVAQAKMAGTSQMKNHPVAPPVYRPQAAPQVLQTKQTSIQRAAQIQPQQSPIVQRFAGTTPPQGSPKAGGNAAKNSAHSDAGRSRVNRDTPGMSNRCIQMRQPEGFYKLTKDANLRDARHLKIWVAPKGTTAYAVNNRLESYFQAGTSFYSPTNEHTWVEIEDPGEPDQEPIEGWIEDSKLERAPRILQEQFNPGDKLYGRKETRRSILWSRKNRNASVRAAGYNIIDDVNDEILRGVRHDSPLEVRQFAAFAEAKRVGEEAKDIRIRHLCKLGLAYTTGASVIHFMLDGLNEDQIVLEAVNTRNDQEADANGRSGGWTEKNCTGAELRALMRQRLHDIHAPGGDDSGINLTNVRFYLEYAQVPAPWSNDANQSWRKAWLDFKAYRAQLSAQKQRIALAKKSEVLEI